MDDGYWIVARMKRRMDGWIFERIDCTKKDVGMDRLKAWMD